uniref:Peptidase S28 n=1 Tax=Mycena chlorophos TaxID=658473 RepID=A0ABQ0LU90_MYCCL|nr:predicted protein [Mycena chlorophos]
MRLSLIAFIASGFSLASASSNGRSKPSFARKPKIPLPPAVARSGPVVSRNGTVLPPLNQTFTFQQLKDHTNPSLGTFTQRFWTTSEFYEEGGPIILFTPGETNAEEFTGYLTNETINGQIAQQENGATIVLEHRFYGLSNPLPDLSVESLRLHTIQQAIDDLEYFANNVVLPMPNGGKLKPDTTPWILIGGSYSGALTSWTLVNKPGLFAAGYASSAVVEAILTFWEYFEPERLFMPANCSADVEAVIAHIDEVFMGSDEKAIQEIKTAFGMGDVTHLDDVASALQSNLFDWRVFLLSIEATAAHSPFTGNHYYFPATEGCSLIFAMRLKSKTVSTRLRKDGASLTHCPLGSPSGPLRTLLCFAAMMMPRFWTVCNFVGYLQVAAPVGNPTLVSRVVQDAYELRQCEMMFEAAFSSPPTPATAEIDRLYAGWNVTVDNLFFANGQRDPWRYSTVSAPGVELVSTQSQPIEVGPGFHCSDLLTIEGTVNDGVLAVQTEGLAAMKRWIAAWKPKPAAVRRGADGDAVQRLATPNL